MAAEDKESPDATAGSTSAHAETTLDKVASVAAPAGVAANVILERAVKAVQALVNK